MDPTTFNLEGMNWLGFGLAIVANIIIGFVWYAPWFPTGKIWMRVMKIGPDHKPPASELAKAMVLMVFGAAFMMFIFAHDFMVHQDAYRNVATGGQADYTLGVVDALAGGFFTWLGFVVPLNFNAVAFDKKPWSLFWVNSGYYLVALIAAGLLLVTVGV